MPGSLVVLTSRFGLPVSLEEIAQNGVVILIVIQPAQAHCFSNGY